MSAAEARPRLEAMCDKGLVMDLVEPATGQVSYLLSPPVVGFFEFSMMRAHDSIPKQRMAEALDAYMHGDDTFAREVFGGETVIGRALVHETRARRRAARRARLGARHRRSSATRARTRSRSATAATRPSTWARACDAPMEICLSLNGGADFVVRRKLRARDRASPRRSTSWSTARERGLVQIADNVLEAPDLHLQLLRLLLRPAPGASTSYDLPAVNPSGFLAPLRPRERAGLLALLARLPDRGHHDEARARRRRSARTTSSPVVDEERCIGCGVCADACKKDAMRMRRRTSSRACPRTRSSRRCAWRSSAASSGAAAVRRGRQPRPPLPEHGAARAVRACPPAQRVLASEQVSSRFVRAVLSHVRDPTA